MPILVAIDDTASEPVLDTAISLSEELYVDIPGSSWTIGRKGSAAGSGTATPPSPWSTG
jgi:hypothetical protein